jgi:hypothetical protein
MIAQVDPDGVLRVQMPERLNNVTIDATILFTATEDNTLTWADKSNLLSNILDRIGSFFIWSLGRRFPFFGRDSDGNFDFVIGIE